MPRNLAFFLAFWLVFSTAAFSLPGEPPVPDIFAFSDYEDLKPALLKTLNSDPDGFYQNEFDYLLARSAQDSGDLAMAFSGYASALERSPALSHYAGKHLSELMRDTGNLAFERILLNEIAYGAEPVLSEPAIARIARNKFESREYEDAIQIARDGIAQTGASNKPKNDRSLTLLLGKSFLGAEKKNEAADVFRSLTGSAPDDLSLESTKGLDLVENGSSNFGRQVAKLPIAEHRKRASIYQTNRSYSNARLHYQAIIDASHSNEEAAESMFEIGRGYEQQRDYKKAIEFYERVTREMPESEFAENSLYGTAGSQAGAGDSAASADTFGKFIDRYPKSAKIERAFMNIVDVFRDSGDTKKALEWTGRARERFKGEVGEAVALFAEARIYLSGQDWNRALAAFNSLEEMNDLGGDKIAGGTDHTEVKFLKGVVLEKLGKKDAARGIFRSFKSTAFDYYSWRAGERLAALDGATSVESTGSPDNKTEMQSRTKIEGEESFGTTGNSLLKLGLYDEAGPAIENHIDNESGQIARTGANPGKTAVSKLAEVYSNGGFADRSLKFAEAGPKGFSNGASPSRFAYPVPFRSELLRHSRKYEIDPRFLLSIMRQESGFQADVKSNAAARGLMQFIAGTSRSIAKELQIDGFNQDELYDPDTAIRFGSHYISAIYKDFPAKPQAVAAGYNGGEDRMARWLKRAKTDDPDLYVPEIVFTQTKDYVYKVMVNYRVYKMLYDKNLLPRP